jgi:hypothetical protein
MVFVLSSPRSGSTVFQLSLNAHPQLYAGQELYLLMHGTLGERERLSSRPLRQGLPRALAELRGCPKPNVDTELAALGADCPTWRVYQLLQGLAAPRTLVDKTPPNLSHAAFVARGAAMFASARFVHLVRHPVVQARSYMNLVTDGGGARGWAEAEAEWVQYQRVALDFVATPAHAALTVSVRYEDFVTDPEAVTRRVCASLDIEWEVEMANPYESAEATKSFQSADGRHVGDPKLLRRSAIDAQQADKWRTTPQPEPLRQATRELAGRLGYELLPDPPVPAAAGAF